MAAKALPLWIGGKPRPAVSGKTFETVNPATGAAICSVAQGGEEDIDLACQAAARAAQGPWGKMGPRQRARVLFNGARIIREKAGELALIETKDAGKPLADSQDEMGAVADCFEYYAGAVSKFFGETIPVSNAGLALTLREPVGVCGLIVPWNYPAVIAAWKLAPALACGNTAVLKPAQETPLSALKLAEYLAEAGLPEGVLSVVPGPGPGCGSALVEHPLVRKVSFTGSTLTGKAVMKAAAESIKRVSLELGGKSPNIVFDDADLDLCVEKSVFSVFSNAGQDCCARSRAIVHQKVYDKFLEKFVARARRVVVGDPMKKGTEVGPLISPKQRDKVMGLIASGREEGAELLCGGEPPKSKGYYLLPAVFGGVKPGMRIAQEEIFGPVLCVIPFKTEEEAVALANDSVYGLSGSLWTRDIGRALRVARGVQSGVLSVNTSSSVFIEAPFGGYKASGLGRELGMKAMELYSETKNVFISEN